MPALGPTELSRRPFRRGVRGGEGDHENALTAGQLQALAARISELVQWKHLNSGPFRTLQEFLNPRPEYADQSLLERAIADTGLNHDSVRPLAQVAAPEHVGFSSATLTQADLLTALSPYLRVRSDTFAIRVRAEALNPVTGVVTARAAGEAIVQRFPQPVRSGDSVEQPAGLFGRRFELISFRWLSPAGL